MWNGGEVDSEYNTVGHLVAVPFLGGDMKTVDTFGSRAIALLLAAMTLGIVACEKEGSLEEAGEALDERIEDAREDIEDAADEAAEAAADAAEDIQEAAQDAEDALRDR
jgi:hypothetical protein